jgi:hypothetical protein
MWIFYNFKSYQTWELNTKPLASSNEALPLDDQLNSCKRLNQSILNGPIYITCVEFSILSLYL